MHPKLATIVGQISKLGGEPVRQPLEALERLHDEMMAEVENFGSLIAKQSGQITHLKARLKSLETERKRDKERIAALLHEQYSPKSETGKARERQSKAHGGNKPYPERDPYPNEARDYSSTKVRKPRNSKGRRPKNWGNLERIEIDMGFPETCLCGCGGTIRSYDIDEKREVIPARFYVAVRKYPRVRTH